MLLIVPNCKLQMAWNYPGFLVIPGCISSKLKYFSRQIFHHSCHVDGRSSPNPLSIVPLPQKSMNSTNGKLQPCTARTRFSLALYFASFTTPRHISLRSEFKQL